MKTEKRNKRQNKKISSETDRIGLNIESSSSNRKWMYDSRLQSVKMFRKANTFSPIGTALFDLRGKYLEVDNAYTNILGISEKALIGKTSPELIEEREPGETRKYINELFAKGLTGGLRELQLQDKNLILSYVNTLLYDNEEEPIGIISMIQDLTELKGPENAVELSLDLHECVPEIMKEPSMEITDEWMEIPAKRFFFDFFKMIPKKFKRGISDEIEINPGKSHRIRGFAERILHKSLEMDDFMYEFDRQSFWRRKYNNDEADDP